jgi:hypothetical protein
MGDILPYGSGKTARAAAAVPYGRYGADAAALRTCPVLPQEGADQGKVPPGLPFPPPPPLELSVGESVGVGSVVGGVVVGCPVLPPVPPVLLQFQSQMSQVVLPGFGVLVGFPGGVVVGVAGGVVVGVADSVGVSVAVGVGVGLGAPPP